MSALRPFVPVVAQGNWDWAGGLEGRWKDPCRSPSPLSTPATPTIYGGCFERWHFLPVPLALSCPLQPNSASPRVSFFPSWGFIWLLYLTLFNPTGIHGAGVVSCGFSWKCGFIPSPVHCGGGTGLGDRAGAALSGQNCRNCPPTPYQLPILYSWTVSFLYSSYPQFVIKHPFVVFASLGGHEDGIVSDLFTSLSSVPAHTSRCSVNTIE